MVCSATTVSRAHIIVWKSEGSGLFQYYLGEIESHLYLNPLPIENKRTMGLIAHLRSKQLHKSMIIPQHRLREKKHGPLFEQTRFLFNQGRLCYVWWKLFLVLKKHKKMQIVYTYGLTTGNHKGSLQLKKDFKT